MSALKEEQSAVLAALRDSIQRRMGQKAIALGGSPSVVPQQVPSTSLDVQVLLEDHHQRRRREEERLFEVLLLPGAVVELEALPGAGAMSVALRCVAEALRRTLTPDGRAAGHRSWLCAIDPEGMLHAPAVASLGVPLERMMVLSPSTSMVARTAVRAMRTQSFCAMVVDATGIQALDRWPVVVRRLTHAAEDSAATVFVLTSPTARRGPKGSAVGREALPVAARVEVSPRRRGPMLVSPETAAATPSADGGQVLDLRVVRHRFGREMSLEFTRPPSQLDAIFEDDSWRGVLDDDDSEKSNDNDGEGSGR